MNETLCKDIDRIYQGIQHLNLEPTKVNTAIILDTLQVLENVYRYLKEGITDVGRTSDSAADSDHS
jgi:hypothetical protein